LKFGVSITTKLIGGALGHAYWRLGSWARPAQSPSFFYPAEVDQRGVTTDIDADVQSSRKFYFPPGQELGTTKLLSLLLLPSFLLCRLTLTALGFCLWERWALKMWEQALIVSCDVTWLYNVCGTNPSYLLNMGQHLAPKHRSLLSVDLRLLYRPMFGKDRSAARAYCKRPRVGESEMLAD